MQIITIAFGLLFGIFILPKLNMMWAIFMIIVSGAILLMTKFSSNENTSSTPIETTEIKPEPDVTSSPDDEVEDIYPTHISYQLMRTKYKKAPAGAKLSLEKMTEYINYCVNDFISLYAYYLDEENRNPISSSFVVFLRCFPYDQQDYYKQRFINMLNRETYNESFIKSGKETAPIKIFIEDIFDEIEYKEYNDFTSNQLFHIVTQIQCWLLYALTLDDDKRILSVVTDPYNQEQTYNKILEKTKSRVNDYDNSESIQSSAVYLRKTIYDDSTN